MRDERFSPGSEVEGMRDESFRTEPAREAGPTHREEAEGVNEIVLRFNTELATTDLSDRETFRAWLKDAEYVREMNPEEGVTLLGKLNERLKEQKLESYMEEVENDPPTDEQIDKILGKAAGR